MENIYPYPILSKTFWAKRLLSCILICTLHTTLNAQVDPHFSQYYLQPMSLNPALTGAIDGDYRVAAIFRSQYGNTLTTKGVSAEVVTNKNTNIGFNILNQGSADQSYNYTNGYLSMAYTGVRFGKNADHVIAMALECGLINRRFDPSKLQFGSQWVSGVGYDAGNVSGESIIKPSVLSFDAGVGIAYYDNTPNKLVSFFGGVSAFHITRPTNPYISSAAQQRLDMRYNLHGGARIVGSDTWSFIPSIIYMREGTAEEKMAGAYFQVYANENTDFIAGANYRWKDAIIPFAGFYYKGLTFGVSYDINANATQTVAVKRNSMEISVSFTGKKKSNMSSRNFYCPRF
jgi:type IX secretion system PorP/SprF family membrane protein